MLVFAAVLGLDQLTKHIVVLTLPLGASWPQEGFFRFTHVVNTGSAFGLFSGQNLALTIASIVGIGVLVLFYRTHPSPGRLVRMSLGLMLAGAVGNLIDRIVHGHVIDFVDIGPWYIFNVADSAIVTGVIILAGSMLLHRPAEQPRASGESGGADSPVRDGGPVAPQRAAIAGGVDGDDDRGR